MQSVSPVRFTQFSLLGLSSLCVGARQRLTRYALMTNLFVINYYSHFVSLTLQRVNLSLPAPKSTTTSATTLLGTSAAAYFQWCTRAQWTAKLRTGQTKRRSVPNLNWSRMLSLPSPTTRAPGSTTGGCWDAREGKNSAPAQP